MRSRHVLVLSTFLAGGAVAAACGSSTNTPDSSLLDPDASTSGQIQGGLEAGGLWQLDGGEGEVAVGEGGVPQNITSMRFVPDKPTISISPGQPTALTFKVMATIDGREVDVTSRTVFDVVEGWTFAQFKEYGPELNIAAATAQGGRVVVRASAANSDGTLTTITLAFDIGITGTLADPRGTTGPLAIPPNAADLLAKAAPDAARAPAVIYPNDGVMLPPNMASLDVHFQHSGYSLFEVAFRSDTTDLKYLVRCGAELSPGNCGFRLDQVGYRLLAQSNRGRGPLTLTVRGTNDAGTTVGTSKAVQVQFAQETVDGALYYWRVQGPDESSRIMRYDFGSTGNVPEAFLSMDDGLPKCVGCHALSRDGTKMVSSLGGQFDGRIVYLNDLRKAKSDPSFFTLKGDQDSRIQFASFNADGSRFVANYGDTEDLKERNTLWLHDGNTGKRLEAESIHLNFEPDHPDWSPDGKMIAFTHVGHHNTSQQAHAGSIDLVLHDGTQWSAPVNIVPNVSGKSRVNPNFAPDSSFFVFTESTCPGTAPDFENNHPACDGDSDQSSKVFAVQPRAGATPIYLAKAGAGGVLDGASVDLADTFPRFSPFQKAQGTGKLFWATITSRRRVGAQNTNGEQQLWMFAIDPTKVMAGQDGSYAGFWLPFQEPEASNHIGQWTTKLVSDKPPPPPPAPPTPPGQPPRPKPPLILR